MSIFLAISDDSPFTKLSNLVNTHYKEKDKNEVKESVMLLFKLATSPQPGHRLTAKMIMAGYTPTKQANETWDAVKNWASDAGSAIKAAPGQAYDAVKKVTYDDTGIGDTVKKTINDAASGALQDSVSKWWESTPEAQYGLYAGLGGAGLGLLRNLTRKRDKGRKFVSDVGTGMLLGGLGGAGYGAIERMGKSTTTPPTPEVPKAPETSIPEKTKEVAQAARDSVLHGPLNTKENLATGKSWLNNMVSKAENLAGLSPEDKQKVLTANHVLTTGTLPNGDKATEMDQLRVFAALPDNIKMQAPVDQAALNPESVAGRANLEGVAAAAAGAGATGVKRVIGDRIGNFGAENRLLRQVEQQLATGKLDDKTKAILASDSGVARAIAAKTHALSKTNPAIKPMTAQQVQDAITSSSDLPVDSPLRNIIHDPGNIKASPDDYRASSMEAGAVIKNKEDIAKLTEVYKQKELSARALSTDGLNRLADLQKLQGQLQAAQAAGNAQQVAALQAAITKTQNDINLTQHKLLSERDELLKYKNQISELESINKGIASKPFPGKTPIKTQTFANAGVRQVPIAGQLPVIGGGINRLAGVNMSRKNRILRDIIVGQLGAHAPHMMGFKPTQHMLYHGNQQALPILQQLQQGAQQAGSGITHTPQTGAPSSTQW